VRGRRAADERRLNQPAASGGFKHLNTPARGKKSSSIASIAIPATQKGNQMIKYKNLSKMSAAALGLFVVMGAANAGVLSATDATFGSFDQSSGTRALTLGSGQITDVNITIAFAKCNESLQEAPACIRAGDPFLEEIVFRLTNPFGTVVNLVNDQTFVSAPGAIGAGTIEFDDEAGSDVGGPNIVSGSFRPVGLLSGFDGQDAAGVWTLFIHDVVLDQRLDYFSSTLTVTTLPSPVPEPGSLALFGAGLIGLVAARKRQQT
jgi:PEP-CTERM motif